MTGQVLEILCGIFPVLSREVFESVWLEAQMTVLGVFVCFSRWWRYYLQSLLGRVTADCMKYCGFSQLVDRGRAKRHNNPLTSSIWMKSLMGKIPCLLELISNTAVSAKDFHFIEWSFLLVHFHQYLIQSHKDCFITPDVQAGRDMVEVCVIDNVLNGDSSAHPVFKRITPPRCWYLCLCCGHGSSNVMRIATVVWGAAAVLLLLNAAWPRGWMITLSVSQRWAG